MRTLIHAAALVDAGGKSVGLNFLRSVPRITDASAVLALVPDDADYRQVCADAGIESIKVRRLWGSSIGRIFFDTITVPHLASKWAADVIFSMGNIGPPRALQIPQVVLFHNAYYVYDSSEWANRLTTRERLLLIGQRFLFRRTVRHAAAIIAQTHTMATRLCSQEQIASHRVHVVPNAVPIEHVDLAAESTTATRMRKQCDGAKAILTVSRYYAHKNLEFVVDVADRMKRKGERGFVFFITIEARQHPGAAALLQQIRRRGLEDIVINLGSVPFSELPGVYRAADALFLPTMLESFSGTYLEAMLYGVPILTADRDFAHEVCSDRAIYFDPRDPDDAISCLYRVEGASSSESEQRVRYRTGAVPSWSEIAKRYFDVLRAVVGCDPDSPRRHRGRAKRRRADLIPASAPSEWLLALPVLQELI